MILRKDEEYEKLLKEYEAVTIPSDAIQEMYEDDYGLIRLAVGISPKTDIRLQFSKESK